MVAEGAVDAATAAAAAVACVGGPDAGSVSSGTPERFNRRLKKRTKNLELKVKKRANKNTNLRRRD